MNNLLASFFTPEQTATIVAVAVVGVALIVLNIVLWYVFHKRGERKLYDRLLQQQRELLMQKLDEMRENGDSGETVSQEAFFTKTVYVPVPAEQLKTEETEEVAAEEVIEEVLEEVATEEAVEEVPEEVAAEEVSAEEVTEEVATEEVIEEVTEEVATEEAVEELPEEVATEEAVEELPEEVAAEEVTEYVPEEPVEEDDGFNDIVEEWTEEELPDDVQSEEELTEEQELPEEESEEEEEPEPDEIAMVADEAEVEEVVVINGRKIRYNRSFSARIIQSSDELKDRYSKLKNYILSYKGVKNRISWKHETFRTGRNTFARLVVRGKTLCLCLTADPSKFSETKYKVIDLSVRRPNIKFPCLYRINSSRKLKYAYEIIDILMAELGLQKSDSYTQEDFKRPYQSLQELVDIGLIKVTGEIPPELFDTQAEKLAQQAAEAAAAAAQPTEQEAETEADEVLYERDFEILEEVDVQEAATFSDEEAEQLVEEKTVKKQKTAGKKKGIVNIDALSKNYEAGAHVTIDNLHEKGLVSKDITVIKVLAKGVINKPLIVEADDFSIEAIKMIVLTGGRVIRRKISD